jgi:hypothetical protein
MAGLDPSLQGIEAAELPKGAIIGKSKNSFGEESYEICPRPASQKSTSSPSTRCPNRSRRARASIPPACAKKSSRSQATSA